MKFTKFGKAVLMSALSVGVVLSVTSCNQSYTVGYLYVTGTETAGSSGNGYITGYRIDHNTGALNVINGLPIGSGGSNPERAVLISGSKFLYVLNRGANSSGGSDCYDATTNACQNPNITQFSVGGNGVLTEVATFTTQGINPFRLIADSSGSYLYVLEHDAPASTYCQKVVGTSTCGDITAFSVDSTTGRLSTVENKALTSTAGSNLYYFPVPANPVDFVLASSYIETLSSTTAQTSFPYTGGSTVFPYTYTSSSGQLTVNQNSANTITDTNSSGGSGVPNGSAIVYQNSYVYVLDNNPIEVSGSSTFNNTTYNSQILPFSVGSGGALVSALGGAVPDDSTLSNPIGLLVESKGKFAYVINQGTETNDTNAESGIAGYVVNTTTKQLTFISGEPWGTGAGPRCIVEDPSDQFLYEANYYSSSITGRVLDPNSGELTDLKNSNSYTLSGPATWCLVDGRTN